MAYPSNLNPVGNLNFNVFDPANMGQRGYSTAPMAPAPQVMAPTPVSLPTVAPTPVSAAPTGLNLDVMNGASFGAANVAGLAGQNNIPTVNTPAAPEAEAGWLKSTFMNEKGGLNLGAITSLLGSAMGIYGGFQQLGLAKDALNFQKDSYRTNLANQTKSYNTAVEDRAAARAAGLGWSDSQRDDYARKNKL